MEKYLDLCYETILGVHRITEKYLQENGALSGSINYMVNNKTTIYKNDHYIPSIVIRTELDDIILLYLCDLKIVDSKHPFAVRIFYDGDVCLYYYTSNRSHPIEVSYRGWFKFTHYNTIDDQQVFDTDNKQLMEQTDEFPLVNKTFLHKYVEGFGN